MAYKDITSAGTWVDIITLGDRDVGKIREIIIENDASSDAVVQLRDEYTDSSGTSVTTDILKRTVTVSEKVFEIRGLKGLRFIGKLQIYTNQQPLKVTIGIDY